VTHHGGLIIESCVTKVERLGEEHFRISAGVGEGGGTREFEARRLLLATGLRDMTPDCVGFRDFYGLSVHHCPDCDGYETTGKRVVVLGHGAKTVGFTLGLMTWTDQTDARHERRARRHDRSTRAPACGLQHSVIDSSIERLEGDAETGQLARACLDDGETLPATRSSSTSARAGLRLSRKARLQDGR
jgi:thioredoxin reductase